MPILLLPSATTGLTLAAVEREVAARVGPFARHGVASATATTVAVDALRSSIEIGGAADMWLLRRGVKTTGVPVAGAVADDRQRRVKDHDPATGTLGVDRPWAIAPVAGEEVELVALDPAQELRPAVQRGLWRCYFEDRVATTPGSYAAERDLTAIWPWLTQPWQVVEFSTKDQAVVEVAPSPLAYARPYRAGGHLQGSLAPDPWPYTAYVTAYRPVASYVNGADSTTGPTADADVLVGDGRFLDYLVAAGVIECWRRVPFKLQPLADARMAPSRQEAADEFSRQAAAYVDEGTGRVQFREPWRVASLAGDRGSWD
jgi:hypothetical protein